MTSLFREEVSEPIQRSFSSTKTSRPASASARATARPTTPAPTTTHSTAPPITAPEMRGHACPSLAPRQYGGTPGDFPEGARLPKGGERRFEKTEYGMIAAARRRPRPLAAPLEAQGEEHRL